MAFDPPGWIIAYQAFHDQFAAQKFMRLDGDNFINSTVRTFVTEGVEPTDPNANDIWIDIGEGGLRILTG